MKAFTSSWLFKIVRFTITPHRHISCP